MKLLLTLLISTLLIFIGCSSGRGSKSNSPLYTLEKVCDLPVQVHETSGIIFFNGLLWTINDSGNDPVLFAIDTLDGSIKNTLILADAENDDWESLTQDENFLYIADNGNNFNNRDSYQLYRVPKDSILKESSQTITPQIINYSFKNSDLERIGLSSKLIDSEAIVVASDSFYVYIKDYQFNHLWVFSFPLNTDGPVTGTPRGQYASKYAITDATLVDEKQLAFIGYKAYHSYFSLLNAMPGLDNSQKELFRFEIVELEGSQTEGLTYLNGKFYISTENSNIKQSLFRLHLR